MRVDDYEIDTHEYTYRRQNDNSNIDITFCVIYNALK